MKQLLLLFVGLTSISAFGQDAWNWQTLPLMPERIANNAVTAAEVNGQTHVFSFSGIDQTKIFSGINLKSFRYNTVTQVWDTIPPLPDPMGGKVAAGANTVNNIIYIIGGYHVFANGSELSSEKVHRYDPETNTYLSDGADLPRSIDDHVQAVWRDSLIYVVTGWHNTTNFPDVQIYDPANDTWQMGDPVPSNNDYRAFGASGVIIGDTIFYYGGAATGFNFPGRRKVRKGVINPNDPTQITWELLPDPPGEIGYRTGAASYDNRAFWIGGSGVTYNFDGIAYNGSGGVDPLARILTFDTERQQYFEGLGAPHQVMDLRGVAQISPTEFIICGGMTPGQVVTDSAFLLTYDPVIGSIGETQIPAVEVFPNPAQKEVRVKIDQPAFVRIYDAAGKLVQRQKLAINQPMDVSQLSNGIYTLSLNVETTFYRSRLVVKH